jgi:PAS domain S-box-containing protein
MLDRSGQILAWNTACARQFGYKPDGPPGRPLGETFDTLVPEAATDPRHNSLGSYLTTGIGIDRDATGRRKDGSLFPIRLTLGAIADAGAAAFVAVIHDLSEQHRAQDRQRDREAQFRRLFESSPIGAVLATADEYRFVQVNPAFCHMLGYAPDELVGRTRREILHPDDPPAEPSDSLGLTATQRFITKSGEVVIGRVGAWRISGEADGQPVVLGLTEDVTARQQMEAQLRQVQRLEAVGQLTGGIAHDFNNLLGVIIGNIEFLNDALHDKPAELELGEEILHSAISGAELTRRLLAFARQQKLQPKLVDLNAYLPPQIALLQRTLGDAITISATLAPDLWPTVADLSQIGDALLNLAINARDAMPEGGRLTIETANAHFDADPTAPCAAGQAGEPPARASPGGASPEDASPMGAPPEDDSPVGDSPAGDWVVLSVSDTGNGMSPEVIARAREPFFTTKPPGVGTGLGLSMIYGFARQSGGNLKIESTPRIGTTVRLYLPRSSAAAVRASEQAAAAEALPRGSETILVVDDNPQMLAVTARSLTALGYTVRVAANGPAALRCLRAGERFDLLFTDVIMPAGMNGYQLAEAARQACPGIAVLFTTGYAHELNRGDEAGSGPVLYKPYHRRQLAEKIRAALHEGC